MKQEKRVLVVGAGLAGLCCAAELQKHGVACTVFEAEDSVGGRVKTDHVSGFLLDRGFQVLLSSYPEVQRSLQVEQLRLGQFEPGALVRYRGSFSRFVDPWRRPFSVFSTLFSPVATFSDKIRVARLRQAMVRLSEKELENQKPQSTLDYLREFGFSSTIIDHFFRPFFGGVFLESDLETSSAKFKFLFRMFSTGLATLPAQGMQAIAEQLSKKLDEGTIEFDAPVDQLTDDGLILSGGREVAGDHVVLATPAHVTSRLLGETDVPDFQQVGCFYFSADQSPLKSKSLAINGEGTGPIKTVCVPSDICPTYAPEGKSLISVSVLANSLEDDLDRTLKNVQCQLGEWFGDAAERWEHIKSYRVTHALPKQTPDQMVPLRKQLKRNERTYVCGDHTEIASIQGAMHSGRRVAESILNANT